jgi:hypothetical protein
MDGKLDLIVTNSDGSVGILLGNGDGTFQQAHAYGVNGVGINSVAVADVNGDGKPDLVASSVCLADCSQKGGVGVLLGNGDGTFQSVVTYGSDGFALSVAVADVNGDGKPDVLVANEPPNSLAVLLGNGDGTFKLAVTYDLGVFADSIAIADVNGDNKPDVVLAVGDYHRIGAAGVMLGNGDGTFQPMVTYSSLGYNATFVAAADVNGDGSPDLLVTNECNGAGCLFGQEGTVAVLLNNTPFCTTPPTVTLSATPTSLWPPNGKMVPVTVSGTTTNTGCTITSATFAVTDEYGKVQPSGPVTLGPQGTYGFIVWLQASRLGRDLDGRQYTVTVSATNNGGNTGSQSGTVVVPHDMGH